ncbi:MAG: low molecular weight phosphotyrosine protein phosphatase [Clostridia bacterium]|nr:low molecular weight phosphotyrosine protein phosphatase [Clostridia bacterium]
MTRVMFVCHGNICRSPMAECIFEKMVKERGYDARFTAASSAVSREEIIGGIGNPIYPPARAELARRGVPMKAHRAVQLTKADYERYDFFLCMDESNLRGMLRIFGADPQGKCKLLLSYTPGGGQVSDPWYSGDFARAFEDIERGCAGFLNTLTERGIG